MELQPASAQTTLNRRRFVQSAAGAVAAAGLGRAVAWPATSDAHDLPDQRALVPPPRPIPGGIQLPGGPQIHVWAPGPGEVTLPFSGLTLQGLDVEPSTFTDRRGFSAVAFHAGTATGSDGVTYNLETDLRAYQGPHVAADGTRRFGTFAFI